MFSDLTGLTHLNLSNNPNSGDDLPLTVTVEKEGTDQARAKVAAGAPFAVDFTPTVVNGSLAASDTKLAVAAGAVNGTAVTVTRTSGTTAAVTVDIDLTTQPSLPTNHSGYEFVKASGSEPAEILPAETALPTLSVADANADEGNAVEFTVTLSEAAAADVTVTWTASLETGDTAETGDFTDLSAATGTLTFSASTSQTTATFTVATAQDSTDEANETFTVTLSGVSTNAQLAADATAKGTIDNDDWPPLAWSTTLTVGNHFTTTHLYGYIQRATGSLTDEDFEFGSNSYVVTVVAVSTEGTVVLYLDRIGLPTEDFMTLEIGGHEFPFADRKSESADAVWVWDAPADLHDPATNFPVGSTATVCLRSEGQMCPTPAPPDSAPTFTSSATFDAAENQTVAGTVVATDSDAGDDVTGYAITVRAITLGTDQGAVRDRRDGPAC